MANTITQTTILGGGSDKRIIRSVHFQSDGTDETVVVYNNSDFVGDVSKGNLRQLWMSGSYTGALRIPMLRGFHQLRFR